MFALEIELGHESYETSWQYIGEAANQDAAADLVTDFAALADCEIEAEFDSVPIVTGGGILDVPGASGAAVLEFSFGDPATSEWGEFRLVVLTAGPRVTALAFTSSVFGEVEPDEVDHIIAIAATKLAG